MSATRKYLSGFGNSHSTEAIEGVLPEGQNSPQRVAHGLYAEKFSSTAFTAPRNKNARSWFYRIRPSVVHGVFEPAPLQRWKSGPSSGPATTPNQLRWDPLPVPQTPVDFLEGLTTVAVNGDVRAQVGIGIHVYAANTSMEKRYCYNADGELLIVPQYGDLVVRDEENPDASVIKLGIGDVTCGPAGCQAFENFTEFEDVEHLFLGKEAHEIAPARLGHHKLFLLQEVNQLNRG